MIKTVRKRKIASVINDENVCVLNHEHRMVRKDLKRKYLLNENIDEKRVSSYFNVKNTPFNLHINPTVIIRRNLFSQVYNNYL